MRMKKDNPYLIGKSFQIAQVLAVPPGGHGDRNLKHETNVGEQISTEMEYTALI